GGVRDRAGWARGGLRGARPRRAWVSTLCGFSLPAAGGPREPLNGGLGDEVARRLAAMPGCGEPIRRGRTHVLPYTPFAFACLADELAASAAGLDVYLHTFLNSVEIGARRFDAVRVNPGERTVELAPRAVVDASGDAALAHPAGAATVTTPLPERQL